MENMTLYELTSTFIDTLESLDCIEDEDERNDAIMLVNQQMSEEIQTKSDNIAKYEAHLNVQESIVDNEIKRLQELKKSIQRKQERLNNSIMYCMNLLGIDKIETAHGDIKIKKNPLSVELKEDVTLDVIPQDFIREKVTKELDKNAIKDLYKNQGIKLEGINYIDDKKSISFK